MVFFLTVSGAGAQQAGLLSEQEADSEKVQLIGNKLQEDTEGVVVMEPEVKEIAAEKKPAEAPAAAKPSAEAKAAAETKVAPAAAKPVTQKKVSPAAAKPAAETKAAPAAAKPAVAAVPKPAEKPVRVEAYPAQFELQAPAVPKPSAEPDPAKPAAKSVAAAKPAVVVKPAAAVPSAAPAVPAPAVPQQAAAGKEGFDVDKKHTVIDGETLWDLSGRYYKDPYKWGKIYNANLSTVENPDRIYPKEELVIPGITEQVRPAERAPEAAPSGDASVTDLRFEKYSEPEVPPVPEGDDVVTEVRYSKPAPADIKKAASKAGVMRDDMDAFERNDLSAEMPADQKEWSTFIKVVPDNWQADGVVSGRVKTGYDSVDEGLALSGEKVRVRLSPGVSVKEGDVAAVYLRGAPAFDKKGVRLGYELQPAGVAQVVSVENRTAVLAVTDATSSVRKGMLVKVTMRY